MKLNLNKKITIGFIGAGSMGLPMLKNLISSGCNVTVYDINTGVTNQLEKENIRSVNNLRSIAHNDFIISMPPDTPDVLGVFNRETGIHQFLKPGTIVL